MPILKGRKTNWICAALVIIVSFIFFLNCGKKETAEQTVSSGKETAPSQIPEDADIVKNIEIGKYGGNLIMATISLPKTFNPIISSETSSMDILSRMFDALVGRDNVTQQLQPALAKRWKRSDDGLVWTFYLRQGVQWSDGEPFTADDVVFTYNDVIYNPDVINDYSVVLRIDGKPFKVEKVDDYTVKVTLPEIYAPFLEMFGGVPLIPKHKLAESIKSKTFDSVWSVNQNPREIIGTGPFTMDKYEPDVKVVLKKNPYYWRVDSQKNRLPYLDRVIFLDVSDTETMTLKFQNGESDVLDPVYPASYMRLKQDERKKNYTIYDLGPELGQSFVWFNLNEGINKKTGKPYLNPTKLNWFKNLKFRKAIAYSIDKKGIIDTVLSGRGIPQYSILSPSNKLWYTDNVVKYKHSLEKARALLDEIGFEDKNGDGIREDEKGNPIKFSLMSNKGNVNREKTGVILRSSFKEIGIDMALDMVDFNSLIDRLDNTFDYEACYIGFTGDIEPVGMVNLLSSSGKNHMWWPLQDKPHYKWEAKIDELINSNLKTYNSGERKKYFDEIQYIISDQLPLIHLVISNGYVGVSNKFGNVKPTVLLHHTLWNVDEIYVK